MIAMTHDNAVAIVKQMIEEKHEAIDSITNRLVTLTVEQSEDPDELTAAYIKRLQTRLVHTKLEREALGIVLGVEVKS